VSVVLVVKGIRAAELGVEISQTSSLLLAASASFLCLSETGSGGESGYVITE